MLNNLDDFRTGNINAQRRKIVTFFNDQNFVKEINGRFFKNNFEGRETKEGVLLTFTSKTGEISETNNESNVNFTIYLKSNPKCQKTTDILYEYCKEFVMLKTKDDLNICSLYPISEPTEVFKLGDFWVQTFDVKAIYFENRKN